MWSQTEELSELQRRVIRKLFPSRPVKASGRRVNKVTDDPFLSVRPCCSAGMVSTCWQAVTEVWCPSGRSTTSNSCSPTRAATPGSAPWPCHMTKGIALRHAPTVSHGGFFFVWIPLIVFFKVKLDYEIKICFSNCLHLLILIFSTHESINIKVK